MAKQKSLEQSQRKELARLYFLQGDTQKEIAEKVGVSRNTINTWVREEKWAEFKAAKSIGRKELVAKMLNKLNEKIEAGDLSSDEMAKAASAIEKLDKQTNVVTIIEVFSAYSNWLIARMRLDPELTPELVKIMNRYQDLFIGEQIGKTSVTIN
ncbi:MAG: putative DNA-binding transcriptional regulator [Paludibacteraceae bacterium]|nr:putative DNA-binding transcriptional regulator [Paludibacteraceae bacterium]